MTTREQKVQAVMACMDAIIDTVAEMGADGAPATPIYLALSSWGCNAAQFQQLMDALVTGGFLRYSNSTYFFVKRRAQ